MKSFILIIFCLQLLLGCGTMTSPIRKHTVTEPYKTSAQEVNALEVDVSQRMTDIALSLVSPDAYEIATHQNPHGQFKCTNMVRPMNVTELPRLNLSFIDAEIREILLEISMIIDVPIIIDDTVEGIISINLYEYHIDKALNLILSSGNYAYRFMEDYILVGGAEPDSPTFTQLSNSCSYQIQHQSIQEIVSSLSSFYRQFINSHEGSKQISITAPKKIMNYLKSHILRVDHQPPQVKLEMNIVEVSANAMSILGVSWDGFRKDAATQALKPTGTFDWTQGISLADSAQGMMFGRGATRTLRDSLHALNNQGKAEIKSSPSIVTLSGNEANFSSTQTLWLPYQSSNTTSGRSKEVTYGIEMKLIPYVTDDGKIKLNIMNASVSDYTLTKQGQPKIISHSVTNTVNVDNGEYLVLGGLLQEQEKSHGQGVAGLSKIPVIGWLFGNRETQIEKREVLILIRPLII